MSYCSDLIAKRLFDEDLSADISQLSFYPDFAVLKTDGRQNMDHIYESMARGNYIGSENTNDADQERWGFYNVYDFQYPSDAELTKMKAIIIPGSP